MIKDNLVILYFWDCRLRFLHVCACVNRTLLL